MKAARARGRTRPRRERITRTAKGPKAVDALDYKKPKTAERRFSKCEGEDLNLHGSYPASTSIHARITELGAGPSTGGSTLPGAEPDALLANEAQALLDAAASEQHVETERLRAFARACLEMSDTGRLALAVLDGGLFASRRALELAAQVLRDAEQRDAENSIADSIEKTVA